MGKLNQVIAVVSGKKKKASDVLNDAYHRIQKTALFDGIARTYQPKDEEGDKLPPENKAVQVKVSDLVGDVREVMTEMFDLVATQDWANCEARSDVLVNGERILGNVPVTHLLFLEKQLKDVETFVSKLPTLDPAERWEHNEAVDYWATPPSETTKTKKVPKNHIKYEATKEHPAQVEMYMEDVMVGTWKTTKFSGAIPANQKNKILERVRRLQEAVVKAREEANSIDVTNISVGKQVFDFIFR
jgi:hypothetical protein